MQLVLCNNRVVAHGENFLSLGGVVINTETGAKYENATIAECECCPSDINEVGYEYHSGVFVPCAPYGKGNNNGYFMEVCETCATPRNSGIPIKGGLTRENLDIFPILWENASPNANFAAQTISLDMSEYMGFFIVVEAQPNAPQKQRGTFLGSNNGNTAAFVWTTAWNGATYRRVIQTAENGVYVNGGQEQYNQSWATGSDALLVPLRIYGVKL